MAVTALMAVPWNATDRIAELAAIERAATIEPETTLAADDVSSAEPAPARSAKAASAATVPAPAATAPAAAPPKPLAARALAASSLTAPSAAPAAESPAATLASASASDEQATRTTITGCLAYDDDTYMLKNTSGDGAPQSRSWKSGFFRKRSSSVELLDEGQRFRLASHIGQRVETGGILIDRELRVRSLRVLGSCED